MPPCNLYQCLFVTLFISGQFAPKTNKVKWKRWNTVLMLLFSWTLPVVGWIHNFAPDTRCNWLCWQLLVLVVSCSCRPCKTMSLPVVDISTFKITSFVVAGHVFLRFVIPNNVFGVSWLLRLPPWPSFQTLPQAEWKPSPTGAALWQKYYNSNQIIHETSSD